jgi:hypothetical protein
MTFWLGLKLEISYRVIISWRILVSFRGFFEDYIFAWWNIGLFPLFFFCLKILCNVKWQAPEYDKPLVFIGPTLCFVWEGMGGELFLNSWTSMTCTGSMHAQLQSGIEAMDHQLHTYSQVTRRNTNVVWCLLVGMTDFLSSADSVTHIMWQLWDSGLVTGGASCSTFSCVILNYK